LASKDQAIGALIFIVCVVIAVGYLVVLVAPGVISPMIGISAQSLQFWAVAVVVLLAFLAIMFIGAWIGWTMATTPPPKPIEELETEEEKKEEEKEPVEEVKIEPAEEAKTEPAEQDKPEGSKGKKKK